MAIMFQLDLFKTDEEARMDDIEEKVDKNTKSLDKVRKGTYARLNELEAIVKDLQDRQKIIERNLCKK